MVLIPAVCLSCFSYNKHRTNEWESWWSSQYQQLRYPNIPKSKQIYPSVVYVLIRIEEFRNFVQMLSKFIWDRLWSTTFPTQKNCLQNRLAWYKIVIKKKYKKVSMIFLWISSIKNKSMKSVHVLKNYSQIITTSSTSQKRHLLKCLRCFKESNIIKQFKFSPIYILYKIYVT